MRNTRKNSFVSPRDIADDPAPLALEAIETIIWKLPIVPIAPVVSKYFETIRTTGEIDSFHMIVSNASKARDAGLSVMSLGQTIEFLRVFCTQAT